MSRPQQRGHHYARGSAIAECLNPTDGYRGQLAKRGIKPRNHAADNRAALRELSARNREKMLEEAAAQEAQPWKLKEFRGVTSRYSTQPKRRP
eukprot:CAMPEP_0118876822 /NCGR_PEP_ID=MMETSP1163-20130328/17358_1 /TAXON_ID=124430 /ORGANISM="Phaeomonas parva, Strain CCMP2877" /LENGTH=92 /DNA_ID=CAMNT_0006812467 /DNA_START=188 /DNA_END=463 /DNA_ORIENTATION=+